MQNDRVFPHPRLVLCALLLLLHAFLWLATGYLPTQANPYHSYALQAQSWLNAGWMSTIAPGLNRRSTRAVLYQLPPLRPVILLPFVALFGVSTPDHLLTFLAALIGALCAFDMAKKSGRQDGACVFWALFVTAGSNLIFVSMLGWVWYMAQTFAFAFTMAAFAGAVSGQEGRMRRSLFYLACAVGCRPLNLLFFPGLFYLIWPRWPPQTPGALLRRWYADRARLCGGFSLRAQCRAVWIHYGIWPQLPAGISGIPGRSIQPDLSALQSFPLRAALYGQF
jgi:hypothetical protein